MPSQKAIAVVVGAFQDPEEVAFGLKDELKSPRIALIPGNVRGYSEIYIEFPTRREARSFAIAVQATPAPVRGQYLEYGLDKVLRSKQFKMMGGRLI